MHHGFRIDTWSDGQVFMVFLPQDYIEKSFLVNSDLERIDLRALNPIDLILTKIARLNERDWQDIGSCINKYKITFDEIRSRALEIGYAGNEIAYEVNRDAVLKKFFERTE